MKQLHRKDLFGWSEFNQERNLDFHSVLWVREQGNVLIDPLALSDHDFKHLQALGGANIIVITNSDHCRDAKNIATRTGAKIFGPAGEQENFPVSCDRWITDNEEIVPGLIAYQLEGSKTPGELALILENSTLITGDLIRSHVAGELCLLPNAKLTDRALAQQSVTRLASLSAIDTVLTGDGWPVFKHAGSALKHLLED
ncbi:MBL fold metallo-hydrolase [Methyloprofundus sedimenti]|uniref:MBL fold metallo-hydrolase n=1 Tax=Methyloprofundus sedimenti TaxID=1420851 RepID=A0A1V8M514_9GAMM|nr:MBL fold metallo-hydrolase [Methyloprofundus sedimenti]OQK16608.1 MBL fold metallo-hydrolase [Methyloprofundus sedimenti]